MAAETPLARCPFCGGGQPRVHGPAVTGSKDGWRIVCSLCYSAGAGCYGKDSRERAVAAWNRRSPQP